MAKSEKQVAEPKSADIVPMESLFEADAGRGNENISQDDLATPFLKILSGNDPILDDEGEVDYKRATEIWRENEVKCYEWILENKIDLLIKQDNSC